MFVYHQSKQVRGWVPLHKLCGFPGQEGELHEEQVILRSGATEGEKSAVSDGASAGAARENDHLGQVCVFVCWLV